MSNESARGSVRTRYDDSEWSAIAKAVRALGRDADTTWVMRFNEPSAAEEYRQLGCDVEPPSGITLQPWQVMLRTALQRVLVDSRYQWPPPTSHLPDLRELQRKTENLRRMYADYAEKNPIPDLSAAVPRLKEMSGNVAHAIEIIGPNPQRFNRAYWQRDSMVLDLLEIWTGLGGKLSGRRTENFLCACLEPVFSKHRTSAKAFSRSLERLRGSLEWLERFRADEAIHDEPT
jgi:hypothetical protein